MKKIYLGICLLFLGLAFGCSDFLDEESQDEMRPSSVEDLEQLTTGSCYFNPNSTGGYGSVNFYHITDIFSDNIQCNGIASTANRGRYEDMDAKFTWNEDMFWESGDGDDTQFFKNPYIGIGACNVILDNLDAMEGDEDLREYLRGEVLTLRAWYYFHLVNFFGMPYNSATADISLAVPLQLTSAVVEETFPRNTVQEVYDQIVGDMTRGFQLMREHYLDKGMYRLSPKAAAAMLSRVYLYLEDWDKAIAYADTVLNEQPALLDLNTLSLPTLATSQRVPLSVYDPANPVEVIWMRSYGATDYALPLGSVKAPWSASDELCGMLLQGYTANVVANSPGESTTNLRAYFFFRWARTGDGLWYINYPDKPMNIEGAENGRTQGIRTAEVYLNRAEAYLRKALEEGGNDAYTQLALDDLNFLRRHRYMNYTNLEMQAPNALLEICLDERRMELAGETNHRWFDVRRCGITYQHTKFAHIGEEISQTLTEDMYELPIPQSAIRLNGLLGISNVIVVVE